MPEEVKKSLSFLVRNSRNVAAHGHEHEPMPAPEKAVDPESYAYTGPEADKRITGGNL